MRMIFQCLQRFHYSYPKEVFCLTLKYSENDFCCQNSKKKKKKKKVSLRPFWKTKPKPKERVSLNNIVYLLKPLFALQQ